MRALKRSRALMVCAPPIPGYDPERGPTGEGDGGTSSQEDVPTDYQISAKGLKGDKERPHGSANLEEHLKEKDIEQKDVVLEGAPRRVSSRSGAASPRTRIWLANL
uniref:Uncharacterized protein n=1 Tax=Parascaris univalens TaxID=6257 RepID=A0A915A9N7_PARUN